MPRVENTSTTRALDQTGTDPRLERKKEREKAEQAGHREEVPQTQNNKTPEAVQTQKGQNINSKV